MKHLIAVSSVMTFLALAGTASAQSADPPAGQPAVDSALRIDDLLQRTEADPSDANAWTQLGILYIDEGMLAEARSAFISALQAAPTEPSSHLNLAVCLVRMEKWGEAEVPLQSYRTMAPEDVRGWALGGQARLELEDPEGAVDLWLEGLKSPDMPDADRRLLVDEATEVLLHVHDEETEPSDSELYRVGAILDSHASLLEGDAGVELRNRRDYTWLELAERQEAAGAIDQAVESWAHLRQAGSTNPAAWIQPAQALIDQGDLDAAEALATEANGSLPGSAIVAYIEGRIADARGDAAGASTAYRRAAELDPELPGVWPALGEALAKAGDSRGASEALAEAVARGQGGAAAAYNMGVVLSQKNQYREAIPYLQDAVEADPGNRDARRALGTAYRKLDRFADAVEVYQKILDRFGPDARDLYQLAFCEAKEGRNASAAAHYEMVTVLDASNVNAFYGLGNAASKNGEQDRAIEAYRSALALRPDFHGASFGWALALQKKGDYEGAIERYELTLEIKETYSSYVNMAICYQQLGDEETSNEYYALANELKKKG
jgi:tetratricopeptide (TPR) repeat protein